MSVSYTKFLPFIQRLPNDRPLTKQDLLTSQYLIEKSGDLEMYYAPHNEYINKNAKIVIVGITPGWNQMKIAFEQSIIEQQTNHTICEQLKNIKKAASFAGSMRKNLINMLDACGIPQVLTIPSSSTLFKENRNLLHTTSVIKYPVFYKGTNYTGHQPSIDTSPLLRFYAYDVFPDELAVFTQPALVIPLGQAVDRAFSTLLTHNTLPQHIYLSQFPHPSGANGHRIHQFNEHQHDFIRKVQKWADLKESF